MKDDASPLLHAYETLSEYSAVWLPENACRVFEVSVAGTRVVSALKYTTSQSARRDHRQSIRLELAASMLGFIHQVQSGDDDKDEGYLSRVKVRHDPLGRPLLLVRNKIGPSVSFSYCRGAAWSALCEEGPRCGIDAADREDFTPSYPFGRAFNEEEFAQATTAVFTDRCEAAAALWSAKESVVKAIGCGFNLIDPLDVTIRLTTVNPVEVECLAVLDKRALSRVRLGSTTFPVRTFRYGHHWVSVTVSPTEDG